MATVAIKTAPVEAGSASSGRIREQRTYTTKVAVSMALYACLFFAIAFCGPYILPAITLLLDSPLADREVAAGQLLLLHETVWVAIPVLFLGAVLFSLLVTRRVVDAIERLGQSAQRWANGSLSHRVQFREADRLDRLAELLNQGWAQIEQGFGQIQQETTRARTAAEGAVKVLSAQGASGSDAVRHLQTVMEALNGIQNVSSRFH